MRGFYRVYEDGRLILEKENLITRSGRRVIADYLAGVVPSWAGAIAVGTGSTTATVDDKRLEFEAARGDIKSKIVSYGSGVTNDHLVIAKATLDNDVSGRFYEMGVFSASRNGALGSTGSFAISTGDSTEEWQMYDSGSSAYIDTPTAPNTINSRNGRDGIVMDSADGLSYRLTNLSLDLSAFSPADEIVFAKMLLTGSISTLAIRLHSDDSNYFGVSTSSSAILNATGYKTLTWAKSDFVATGTPDWSNITSIEFIFTGTASFMIDGIRMEERDEINSDYAMVSRTILSSPIVKNAGSIMEIEYYLDV